MTERRGVLGRCKTTKACFPAAAPLPRWDRSQRQRRPQWSCIFSENRRHWTLFCQKRPACKIMFVLYSRNFSHDTYNIRHTYKRNLTWDDAMVGQLTPSYLLQISKRVRFRGSQCHTHLASSSSRIWVSIGTIVSATQVWHNWGDRSRSHKFTMPHANWSMSTSSGRSSEALRTPFWGRHEVDVTGMAVACGALTTWNTWGIFEFTSQCPKMAPRGTNCPISSSALARRWYEG